MPTPGEEIETMTKFCDAFRAACDARDGNMEKVLWRLCRTRYNPTCPENSIAVIEDFLKVMIRVCEHDIHYAKKAA